jgi:phosphate:Na+ symporter
MSATSILLGLAGDVGLLLWGTYMATSGVLRGYGTDMRRWLGRSLDGRVKAFLAGLIVTVALQSSTATSLMATSFVSSGIIDLASGLSVMLGANVGTTLIVQVLSFNLAIVAPILILVGVVAFRRGDGNAQVEELGRILIGLGLMLLSLNMLVRTSVPVEKTPLIGTILRSLVGQPVLAILTAAGLTWACHSSVAVMLFIVSLVTSGAIAPVPALALVLGTNLGGTLPAYFESGSTTAQRLPLGNLLIRAVGCVAMAPLLPFIARLLFVIEPQPARMVVNFHTLFNVALAAIFIAPADKIARLLIRLLPDPLLPVDPGVPQYLEEAALQNASVALVNAAREALRMADMIETMLMGALEVFRTDDRKRAAEISHMDEALDRLSAALRHYLAELAGEALNEEDSIRSQEIFSFVINIEHVGDIIANNLLEFAVKKAERSQSFSQHELEEIGSMHAYVVESLKLGLAVFLRGDERAARQLVDRKALIWRMENEANDCYFHMLREEEIHKYGAGDVYLRVLRDLKRIHSHIAALAYPILDRAGLLQNRVIGPQADGAEHKMDKTRPAEILPPVSPEGK